MVGAGQAEGAVAAAIFYKDVIVKFFSYPCNMITVEEESFL